MNKCLLVFILALLLPVYADYNPLSDAPINSVEEFNQDEIEIDRMEFEYPSSNSPQPVESKPNKNYPQIYNDLQLADFSYLHNIDPDQYYDMKDAAWSPYPLLRLNSAIYFKGITIEPGYYLLTPREHNGKWYLLFKQNGVVAHTCI